MAAQGDFTQPHSSPSFSLPAPAGSSWLLPYRNRAWSLLASQEPPHATGQSALVEQTDVSNPGWEGGRGRLGRGKKKKKNTAELSQIKSLRGLETALLESAYSYSGAARRAQAHGRHTAQHTQTGAPADDPQCTQQRTRVQGQLPDFCKAILISLSTHPIKQGFIKLSV